MRFWPLTSRKSGVFPLIRLLRSVVGCLCWRDLSPSVARIARPIKPSTCRMDPHITAEHEVAQTRKPRCDGMAEIKSVASFCGRRTFSGLKSRSDTSGWKSRGEGSMRPPRKEAYVQLSRSAEMRADTTASTRPTLNRYVGLHKSAHTRI